MRGGAPTQGSLCGHAFVQIVDLPSFHAVFAEVMGFPEFYGRNMNARIDCMTDVDDRDAGMTTVTVESGAVLTLHLEAVTEFADRCSDQFAALNDATAFVNWRRIEQGRPAVLALSFHRSPPDCRLTSP
jgi:RNAse (barnase) inhibitor barstar